MAKNMCRHSGPFHVASELRTFLGKGFWGRDSSREMGGYFGRRGDVQRWLNSFVQMPGSKQWVAMFGQTGDVESE